MQLRNAFALLGPLIEAIRIAFLPTLREVIRVPSLLLRPLQVSRLFMSYVWATLGKGIDDNMRESKTALITPRAYGVVLDIGAGYGHAAAYLDKTRATKYIALEPNTYMHDEIRKTAVMAGFSEAEGSFLLLPYGAEEIGLVVSALGGPHTVDTLLSILTLCSVPAPEPTVNGLVNQVLKPGGTMIFHEHVRHRRMDIVWWQRFWTPIWGRVFDGCCLDRPTDVMIEGMGVWEEMDVKCADGETEDEESVLVHHVGILKKASAVVA